MRKNCEVESCDNEAELIDMLGNYVCKDHMEQDIEEGESGPEDYETIRKQDISPIKNGRSIF